MTNQDNTSIVEIERVVLQGSVNSVHVFLISRPLKEDFESAFAALKKRLLQGFSQSPNSQSKCRIRNFSELLKESLLNNHTSTVWQAFEN